MIDFTQPTTGTGSFNVSTTALYGFATIDTPSGNFFATTSSSLVVPVTTTTADSVSTWTGTQNVTDNNGFAGTTGASAAVNTIRFNENTGPSTVTIGSTLTVNAGGILETSNAGSAADTITGGTISASTTFNELVVNQQNTTTALTIASAIVNTATGATPFTKAGLGEVILSGANTYTGITSVDEGTLELSGSGTLGTLSNVVIGNTSTALLDLNGTTQSIGTLASAAGGVAGLGTVNIGYLGTPGSLTINESASTTFAGAFTGYGALTISSTAGATLTLGSSTTTTSSSYAGTVAISGTIVDMLGNGVSNLPNVTGFTVADNLTSTGALTLDNTGSSILVNRTSLSVPITLSNTPSSTTLQVTGLGTITDQPPGSGLAVSENATVGAVTLGGGANTLRAATAAVNGNPQLTMASLTRTNNSTLTVLADDLGASNGNGSTVVPDSALAAERGDIIVTNPSTCSRA